MPGDGVLVMTPLYAPLQAAVTGVGRRLVRHPLRAAAATGELELDFSSRLLPTLASGEVAALLLCNPHNPTGRVWRGTELAQIARACARHGVLVISDEIWADWHLSWSHGDAGDGSLRTPPPRHFPFAEAARASGCSCVTLGAPTKTFNLAGLHCSFAIFEDEELRNKYLRRVEPAVLHYGSTFATTALLAAYDPAGSGLRWLAAAKQLVESNVRYLEDYLARHCPLVVPLRPQATYLVWLDCRALGLDDEALSRFMLDEAKLLLSPGAEFAPETGQWQRINVACSRALLVQAAERLADAVERLRFCGRSVRGPDVSVRQSVSTVTTK